MRILFTRHGQTDWNKEMKIQGRVDIPLNEEGIKQAKELHDKLLDTHIDFVISSPLSRALETAKLIRGERDIPLFTDERILEEYYGEMEGKSRLNNPAYLKQRTSFFKRYPKGESYFDVYHRVASFFEDLKKRFPPSSTILIVGHGGMSRVVNIYFKDMENDDFPSYGLKNCEIVEYEL